MFGYILQNIYIYIFVERINSSKKTICNQQYFMYQSVNWLPSTSVNSKDMEDYSVDSRSRNNSSNFVLLEATAFNQKKLFNTKKKSFNKVKEGLIKNKYSKLNKQRKNIYYQNVLTIQKKFHSLLFFFFADSDWYQQCIRRYFYLKTKNLTANLLLLKQYQQ